MPNPHNRLYREHRSHIVGLPEAPGPWVYEAVYYNCPRVVCDTDGRIIARDVRRECGPLLAAAPTLLATLRRIVRLTPPTSAAHAAAVAAVEAHMEREAIVLEDAPPVSTPRWVEPKVRIVGVAT